MRKTLSVRRAFTLVEMLIVISIIVILASMGTWAALKAIAAAKKTAIAYELSQLAQAVETYRENHSDYPPDFTNNAATAKHISTFYRRYTGGFPTYMTAGQPTQSLDPSEALVFWLGMTNKNPASPFPASPLPVATIQTNNLSLFKFKPDRLQDLDGDGWLSYVPAGTDQPAPYVYFNWRTYAFGNWPHPGANGGVAMPYYSDTVNPATGKPLFVEPRKFQIISSGLDGSFGAASTSPKRFKSGLNYTIFDEDNITSFSQGTTLGDNRP